MNNLRNVPMHPNFMCFFLLVSFIFNKVKSWTYGCRWMVSERTRGAWGILAGHVAGPSRKKWYERRTHLQVAPARRYRTANDNSRVLRSWGDSRDDVCVCSSHRWLRSTIGWSSTGLWLTDKVTIRHGAFVARAYYCFLSFHPSKLVVSNIKHLYIL